MIIPLIFLVMSAFSVPGELSSLPIEGQQNPETLGAYVRSYYVETPVLARIAWCESRMRHLDADGELFRGEKNKSDIGVMQINTYYHDATALALGIDLKSLEGNLGYAKYLYEKEGTKPWNSSKVCWGNT